MKKLIMPIIALCIAVCCLVISVYAWFTGNINISNIIITTGNVDVSAELYKGTDFDLDGNLDSDELGNDIYEAVTELTVTNLCPNDTVSYRLIITNIGDYNGLLSVYFTNYDGDLQYVLVNSSAVRYTSSDINVLTDYSLAINQIYNLDFTLRFATLSELKILSPSEFDTVTDLNYYQNKTFSMTIHVILEQL